MSRKSKKKSPKKNHKKNQKISKVKLVNIFLLVFLFAFLATGTSYFIMKSESSNKNTTEKIIDDTVKTVEEKTKELQEFQKKKLDEYFSLVDNPKEAFEEYTEEFHKDYVDTETHKVQEKSEQKRVEQIKQKAPNEQVQTKIEPVKIPKVEIEEKKESLTKKETSVFTKPQDKPVKQYIHKEGDKPKIVIVIDDVSTKRQKNTILTIIL